MTSNERLQQLTKPRGRKVRVRHQSGDHGPCPTDRSHGPLVMLPSRRLYCPSSAHTSRLAESSEARRNIWSNEPESIA